MKALLLTATPRAERTAVAASFKGAAGHDLERLRRRYVLAGGAWLPQEIADAFNGVSEWGIVLRYSPAETPAAQAASFLAYVDTIVTWADGRL